MPKKSFKDNPALAFIGNAQTATQVENKPQEIEPEPEQPQQSHMKYYRINLKLKAEYKEYLERVSWETHKSITQYLNDLIEADKATRNT